MVSQFPNSFKMIWKHSSFITRFHGFMGSTNTSENRHHHHRPNGLVFDCVIEYLESRFSRYSTMGFNVWSRLPLCIKTEMLTCEIVEEVGRWIYTSGLNHSELIDYEMSYKLGKWTDFDLEAFETGAEVDHLILDNLTDELIVHVLGPAEEIPSLNLLYDKWKAAKEELKEEEKEPKNAYEKLEMKRHRAIEEWRAQQIASGEGEG